LEVVARESRQPRGETETFSEHWQPRTVDQFNGHDLMVVKALGEFSGTNDDTDDLLPRA
jgi:hypothetical protein